MITTPPTAPGLHGSAGPEVHPSRKLRTARLQGNQRKGSGWAHRQTASTHIWANCCVPQEHSHPRQNRVQSLVAAPHGGRSEGTTTRALGWGWRSPAGASLGPQPPDLRANAYLRAAPPHLPQASRSSRKRKGHAPPLPGPRQLKRGADPERPCGLTGRETPDSTSGRIHQSAAVALSRLSYPGGPTQDG